MDREAQDECRDTGLMVTVDSVRQILFELTQTTVPEKQDDLVSSLLALPKTVEELGRLLSDPDDEIREWAAKVLEESGQDAEPVVVEIIRALDDENQVVTYHAAYCLANIGHKAINAVPKLLQWIGSPDQLTHLTAVYAIIHIDVERFDQMLPLIEDALQDEDRMFHGTAAFIAGSLGPHGEPLLPRLQDLTVQGHSLTQLTSADAIWAISGDPSMTISVAVDMLGAEESLDRYTAAVHLRSMGSTARSAVGALEYWMAEETDDAARDEMQRALEAIDEPPDVGAESDS